MELGSDRDYTNNFDFVKYWSHRNLNPQRNFRFKIKIKDRDPIRTNGL